MPQPRKKRNKLLKPSQAIHALHPQVPKNEVIHALRERVKELTALHSTVCVLQDDRLPAREVLDRGNGVRGEWGQVFTFDLICPDRWVSG